jgi:ATP-dependent DNA helicase PIF1
MIDRFPGDKHVHYSFYEVEDDTRNNYPLDFLNSLTPNGLLAHEFTIKKNCPIILLRNLDPHNGLCNGTRLIIRGLVSNGLMLRLLTGNMLEQGSSYHEYQCRLLRI